jgi:hypothetical protein
VRLKREEGTQKVGFSLRPLALCGLLVRKPPRNEMLYERRNGSSSYGLPFGQDRIVPAHLATFAVRQQSQTICFRTAAEMLETFDMRKGSEEYRRLVAAFELALGRRFSSERISGSAKMVEGSRFSFFNEAHI